MKARCGLLLLLCAVTAGPAAAQLVKVSFNTELSFQPDFVNSESYVPRGSDAHLEFYLPAAGESAAPFWRMSLMDDTGRTLYDVWRPLDSYEWDGYGLRLSYTHFQPEEPGRKFFYEALDFQIMFDGADTWTEFPPFPPVLGINDVFPSGHQLYASGNSPFMGYAPIGYGGYFYFSGVDDFSASTVPVFDPFPHVSPVPEPSTYGWAAVAAIAALIAWKRRRFAAVSN